MASDLDRLLIYVVVGLAAGALLSLIRYGREIVRLLASIDEKLGGR